MHSDHTTIRFGCVRHLVSMYVALINLTEGWKETGIFLETETQRRRADNVSVDNTSEKVSENEPEKGAPENVPDNASEGPPKQVPNEQISDHASKQAPEEAPEEVPGQAPSKTSLITNLGWRGNSCS